MPPANAIAKVPAGIATGKLSVSVNGVSAQSSTDFVLGPKAGFSICSNNQYIARQAKMSFTNHSDNALTYEWEFANGTVANQLPYPGMYGIIKPEIQCAVNCQERNKADTIVKEVVRY